MTKLDSHRPSLQGQALYWLRENSPEGLSDYKIKSKEKSQITNQISHSSSKEEEKMRGRGKDQECYSFQNPSKWKAPSQEGQLC